LSLFTVFGAGGMIGAALLRWLTARGHHTIAASRHDWPAAGRELGHAIFAIGLTADSRMRPFETARAHVCKLLDALEAYRYDSFLYLSTTRVYRGRGLASEDVALAVNPADQDQFYNLTKLAGEAICFTSSTPTVRVVRLSNVVAAADKSSNFLASVVQEALRTGSVSIRSAPSSVKDYVALNDAVSLMESIATHGTHRLYNVASGCNVSHEAVANLVRQHFGAEVRFVPDASRIAFPPISIERVRQEFGFSPTPFEDAFAQLATELKRVAGDDNRH
jgi:nucleoside-diphosphate-sugar epimerase